ncbi:hypothetical protein BC829DRAFT_175269 [Chytridium lagenaria]|nr:hypothetical protein BC829DRAFT_175269 [Chytridium lagenaria]
MFVTAPNLPTPSLFRLHLFITSPATTTTTKTPTIAPTNPEIFPLLPATPPPSSRFSPHQLHPSVPRPHPRRFINYANRRYLI